MQGTFHDFTVYPAGSKRAVLVAAECLNCIVFALCIEKCNPCTINVKLLSTVLSNLAPLGDLEDRKSTRLNSSHANISYAVFCLKKKKHTSTISYPSSAL